jgi:protease-4
MICAFLVMVSLCVAGCATPSIKLFSDVSDPLKEYTLEGTGKGKVLLVPIVGVISDEPNEGLLRTRPSLVQEVVSQLRRAEKNGDINAVVLKIDSPGGSVTASDILYHEISAFKKRTGATVVVSMMNVAASGGYYISLPADRIVAHPTTLTGSIGVIFLQPKVMGLMDKIGVSVEVDKSGTNKDMGSMFRQRTTEEQALFQALIGQLAERFLDLTAEHRPLDAASMEKVATARVFLAQEALSLKLVDDIGYLSDAVTAARQLAGLTDNAKLVVYRRKRHADDNFYNNTAMYAPKQTPVSLSWSPDRFTESMLRSGFHYLWTASPGLQ